MHATNEKTTAKMQFSKLDKDVVKYFFSICFKGEKKKKKEKQTSF